MNEMKTPTNEPELNQPMSEPETQLPPPGMVPSLDVTSVAGEIASRLPALMVDGANAPTVIANLIQAAFLREYRTRGECLYCGQHFHVPEAAGNGQLARVMLTHVCECEKSPMVQVTVALCALLDDVQGLFKDVLTPHHIDVTNPCPPNCPACKMAEWLVTKFNGLPEDQKTLMDAYLAKYRAAVGGK